MEILSKITPAETLLIKNYDSIQLKELMKYTFMDLLLKQVIAIKEINRKAHSRDKYIRTYTYVVSGKNFSKYEPKNHEIIYQSPFLKSQSIEILFKHYIKMIYDASNGSWKYQKLTKSNKNISPLFKQTVFLDLFRLNRLTDKGIKIKESITNYLNDLDANIGDLLHNNKSKALELLLSIRGNIFLLKNLDFQLLKTIDKEILNQKKILKEDGIHYSDDVSDIWYYIDFLQTDSTFDSNFDSLYEALNTFDSEFEVSSCSSWDSGCSSCGGCGGCD